MALTIEALLGAKAGSSVTVKPDWFVINDGLSHAAVKYANSVSNPEKVFVFYDHDVPSGAPETSVKFEELWRFAEKNGLNFVQAQGVGSLYMLERYVKPGDIVVGGGEHEGVYGAKGALGLRLDPQALGEAMAKGSFEVKVPERVICQVTRDVPDGASIMDAALEWVSKNDIAGKAVVFVCPSLSQQDRATLCFVACVGAPFSVICADEGAGDSVMDLSLAKPMVMLPCEQRRDQYKSSIEEMSALDLAQFDAGQISGCTGGTIEHMRLAAKLIDGKSLRRGFRLCVCPATSQDFLTAIEEGLIEKFIRFGAQVNAVGERSIVKQGPGTVDELESLVTTGLYTFDGCMGVKGSKVYSASVETVIKAAVAQRTCQEEAK